MNSSILFIAPMKKMILNWDIPIVTRLHRKMGENTDCRKVRTGLSRIGRGPNLSIRIPSGRVVALSKKDPMVKPRFSISS
ncbi:hypothetical protein EYF80_011960 [Liparis tanakae]|uniref:Uncharacterized protein n=1 Tax=Liparis tanakae TaxID=230148 RepID=A0A4Z2IK61_9TELE|nr:hypothetical protein EYF80_011960 [Liparis tanakae]